MEYAKRQKVMLASLVVISAAAGGAFFMNAGTTINAPESVQLAKGPRIRAVQTASQPTRRVRADSKRMNPAATHRVRVQRERTITKKRDRSRTPQQKKQKDPQPMS